MKKERIIALTKTAMRLTFLYALITLTVAFATHAKEADAQGVLDKKIAFSAKRITIKEMIEVLESQSEVHFIYSSSAIKANRKIKIAAIHGELSNVLEGVFKPIGITYKVEHDKILLFSMSQDFTITGTVVNGQDNTPISGAAVKVRGTTRGTSTNDNGQFSLIVNPNEVVEVSYIGFATQEFRVDSVKHVYSIALHASLSTLDEVVVTGYSAQRVKDLTGSVAVVDVNQLKAQPVASPVESLQGKATGVQVISDGAPGATPQIRIRGFSTINNNDPLYVIDGVPFEGKLSWLNQNDIESMQVLKDASAASIYGARANNGVVIITTRKGIRGAPQISLDMYYGTQNPRREAFPEMMNPTQYANYLWQSFENNPSFTPGTSETTGSNYRMENGVIQLPEYLLAGSATGHNVTAADADLANYNYSRDAGTFYQITRANQAGTQWFEEMTHNAPIQNYQLNVSGGGEAATYSISGGYMEQQGIVRHTGFERFNVRSNTTFSALNERLRFGENMQYSYEEFFGVGVNPNVSGDYQGEGSALGFAYRIPTIIPVYDEMGNFAGSRGDKLGNAQNPVAMLYRAKDNKRRRNFFFGNVFTEVDIVTGLTARTSFGLRYENYNGMNIGYPNLEFSEGSNANNLDEWQGFTMDWTWTNTLTYKRTLGGLHDLTVMAGTEAIRTNARELGGARNDFFLLGNLDFYYLSRGATNISNRSSGSIWSMFSIFGRADYSFNNRYLLSATVRRDGSSNFGPENKYGVFPAASAAWRLSEEAFLDDAAWLTDLKIRAGYGVTGNQRIPGFQYLRRYEVSIPSASYPTEGAGLTTGVWQNAYDNPSVKWEQVNSLNLGLDFTLLDGRFDGAFDWYTRKTTDMLYPVPLPAAARGEGNSPFINIGDMENRGIELSLNYHHGQQDNRPFQFDVGANFTKYTNKVISLAPSVTEQLYGTFRSLQTTILRPGEPFGSFFGYQVAGIYQSAEDITNSPSYDGARLGGPKYADISGPDGTPDGVINPFDRTIIGNPHPDFLYSLSLGARYKNFDISMFFNGSQGNDLYEATRYFTDFSTFDGSASVRMLDTWSPSNPSGTIHSPYRGASDFELASSSYYVQDGSFFRMKNLQIGYTFPAGKLFQGKIRNLRLYVSGTNLFTITDYTGLDPEVSQTNSTFSALGVDFGVYPVGRQYLLGLSVGF
ncbi:TonB-linked outer membrane protein, SusC/RagA family [Parapedobacter koreensis]|uniref:TonB-linked outer membrane protein, SusC/RagA family n=2 Tax=Parapedobacter koreensis TaxID=332977 RepID=A0A1H7I4Q7_9SPHI|nr:TonB-linked outer membrane protein, SusC/RagA family [Parapedobacter koreensis]